MTNQEIFELLSRFENSSIQSLKLSSNGISLELSKAAGEVCRANGETAPALAAPAQQAHSGQGVIASPLAGVFYAAPQPGEPPYVAVGDRVKAGQTLCLMEAMKMISEIPAPCDCVITAILKENGKLAAFDEPLFRYQPC